MALQAAQTDHPSAQAVMQASQNRVLSMGIIHQKLYQKGNLAAIEMKDYFQNLGKAFSTPLMPQTGFAYNVKCSQLNLM